MSELAIALNDLYRMVTKATPESVFRVETSENDVDLVAKDGSLLSVIRLDGMLTLIGNDEFYGFTKVDEGTERHVPGVLDNIRLALVPYFSKGEKSGHALEAMFRRDPHLSRDLIRISLQQAKRNARISGLDLADILEEREQVLPKHIVWEDSFLVLWTRPSALSKSDIKRAYKEQKRKIKGAPAVGSAQWPLAAIDLLKSTHRSFVNAIAGSLAKLNMKLKVLEAHEALVQMRRSIYPDMQFSDWRPILPGDRCPARIGRGKKTAVSDIVWPSLAQQVFTYDPVVVGQDCCRYHNTIVASADIDIGPDDPQPFQALVTRLQESGMEIPWRGRFLIEPDGIGGLGGKNFLASILSWANSDNKKIRRAVDGLNALAERGQTIVKWRGSFATWAPASRLEGDDPELRNRASVLHRALETWGNCQIDARPGDPFEATMSSTLAFGCASTATAGAPPLDDALRMLPWTRVASPWERGAVLFRSKDGKLWPWQPGSSLQTAWVDLYFAPMGAGKSVLMNTADLALCMAPARAGAEPKLPRIAKLDIGFSASGLISLLRESLPPHRRHEALYKKLRQSEDCTINPFDTQLGCRLPIPAERDALVNLLTLACTPPGEDRPYDGMVDLIGKVVNIAYTTFSDGEKPKSYMKGQDRVSDDLIARHALSLPQSATWWDVVDGFAARNLMHEAGLAQRNAMPILADLVPISRDVKVTNLFENTKVLQTGETIQQAFQRFINTTISSYKIMNGRTQLDLAGARVVVLDLNEVAPKGSKEAEKQTALMYLLGRSAIARDFFLDEDILRFVPENYRSYHRRRILDLREEPKRLVYDEFHRTQSRIVRQQVLIDIREGRKWGLQIALASQRLEDFEKDIIDLATGIWVLGVGSEIGVEDLRSTFKLSDTDVNVIRNSVTGPGPGGAPFFTRLRLKGGMTKQLLYNTLGPIELWALSTTQEDVQIRNRLYDRIGPKRARRTLSKVYPSGSALSDVERRRAKVQDAGYFDDAAMEGVIDEVVSELVAYAGNHSGQERRVS